MNVLVLKPGPMNPKVLTSRMFQILKVGQAVSSNVLKPRTKKCKGPEPTTFEIKVLQPRDHCNAMTMRPRTNEMLYSSCPRVKVNKLNGKPRPRKSKVL